MAGEIVRRPPSRTPTTDTLRQQFAPQATDDELRYFAQVCAHLDVDPWAGHICLVPYWDADTGGKVFRPQLTVAGRRFIAQRTGRLRGIVGPQWCGPRTDAAPDLVWLDLWDRDDELPYAARVLVLVADWDQPANGTVKWSEFAQTKRNGDLRRTWAAMPSHMLGKVAESLALRRAFAEVQAAVAYVGDDDDTTVIREAEAEVHQIPLDQTPAEVADPAAEVAPGGGIIPPRRAAPAAVPPTAGRAVRRRRDDDVPDWVRDQDPENVR